MEGGQKGGREGGRRGMDGGSEGGVSPVTEKKRKTNMTGSRKSAPTTVRCGDVSLSAADHRSRRDKQVCL